MKSLKTSFAFALVFSILFISTSQGFLSKNYNDGCHNRCNKKELNYKKHLYKAGQDLIERRNILLAKYDYSCERIKNNPEARKEYNDQSIAFDYITYAVSEMSDGNSTKLMKGKEFGLCNFDNRRL
ncbi:MAG: hypothetical protein LBL91_03490 [Lachnospiraceae bacterium]|jgi:hypothetical protein|nr:hypothetical protein [Lachnospiraceae bacterium]